MAKGKRKNPKVITVNGQKIKLAHIRASAKGARVDGARVHVKGLGTVYVQVYEAMNAKARVQAVQQHTETITPQAPTPPMPGRERTPEREADQIDQLIVETLKGLTHRLEAIERRAVVFPATAQTPIPRPSHNGHG